MNLIHPTNATFKVMCVAHAKKQKALDHCRIDRDVGFFLIMLWGYLTSAAPKGMPASQV